MHERRADSGGRVSTNRTALGAAGARAGLASFAGWALGVWFDIGPANLLWVLASGVMCVWLAWLGIVLARTSGSGERPEAGQA